MTALPKDGVADLRRRIAELEQQLQSTVAERDEAIAQQAATADVLQVINSSPADLAPVFEAILDKALQPCDAQIGVLWTYDGKSMHASAIRGAPPAYVEFLRRGPHRPSHVQGRLLAGNEGFVRRADLLHSEGYRIGDSLPRAAADLGGIRTLLVVPLRKHGAVLGTFGIYRQEVKPFSDRQIALVESFAAQAVIAMENARLFNETKEALERQTATADILKVIASSPSNVQPVFDAIARRANTLGGGFSSTVFRFIDGIAYLKAFTPTTPAADEILKATFPRPVADFPPFRMAQAGEVTQVPDTEALSDEILEISRARGFRSMLFAPLMHDGTSIGFIAVTRVQPGNFADHYVQLLQTFADQAVIAIENARLFEEVQAKTRDLTESLQQQTATADVLKVISRSAFDLQAALHTLVESAARLCAADQGTITRQKDGKFYRAESFGHSREFMDYVRDIPVVVDRGSASGRALLEGVLVHIADVQADPEYTFNEAQRLGGYRTCLGVPILREGVPVGVLSLTRSEVRPFTDKQIELVTMFADQAAIAIENARLFEEVQAKTGERTEARTYQTGSSNILSVIASSPTDVAPVLKAIVESAGELCDAYDAIVLLKDGDELRYSAHHGPIPNNLEKWPINRNWTAGRAFLDQKPVHVRDLLSDEGTDFPDARELSQQQTGSLGIRTLLSVPLLREHESIGAILLRRIEVHPFSEKQIALLQTFADQAVIAIGNVHLFEEVQARTEDLRESLDFQTASSDVLKVISSSPDTLQPVLDVIVETSRHLCGTETSTIFLLKDDKFHIAAASGAMPEYLEFLRNNPIALDQAGSSTSRAAREKRTVHIPDIGADPEFGQGPMAVGQRRALLSVPLMREGTAIGVITMRQSHLTPFTERQIEVVQTFADQAVIAISNVRLFEQVQARTQELSHSLNELRTAQDRLVQTEKLASLGQLTAGIAHEIKNPLNFVNNFSALSAELTDELNDVLAPAALSDKIREEVDELTGMLKDNLGKVVQHGKRADSIVKNMLLHSREGSGDHRPADINALLDESLNLAYHGARAEKREFNVTLQRDFDEMAGAIEVFPQEITRVFLNLISNGFYAVTKRKLENGNSGFDPVVRATTKNLGDTVEIRIRDNGTGIPAEVREKMFNPFFTTKPAGEGTGLGLSMSHDIIVKQHGGRIDVETEPGAFTEFIITLPRTSNFTDRNRGQT